MVAVKRLKIARFLFRVFPVMSPVLLYIPTILIAQAVAKEYSSVFVYIFYLLPLVTARIGKSEAKDQKPYRWIVFDSAWTGLYFLPLGIIGLVEVAQIDGAGLIAEILLTNPILYLTILAEVALAMVVMSDVLYLFISSEEEGATADRMIDQYTDAIQEEAQNEMNGYPQNSAARNPYLRV
jgi:hypothetical protein